MDFQMFALVMLFLACVEQGLASCVVDSFTVKQDFEPQRVSTEIQLFEIFIHSHLDMIEELRTDQFGNVVTHTYK